MDQVLPRAAEVPKKKADVRGQAIATSSSQIHQLGVLIHYPLLSPWRGTGKGKAGGNGRIYLGGKTLYRDTDVRPTFHTLAVINKFVGMKLPRWLRW